MVLAMGGTYSGSFRQDVAKDVGVAPPSAREKATEGVEPDLKADTAAWDGPLKRTSGPANGLWDRFRVDSRN